MVERRGGEVQPGGKQKAKLENHKTRAREHWGGVYRGRGKESQCCFWSARSLAKGNPRPLSIPHANPLVLLPIHPLMFRGAILHQLALTAQLPMIHFLRHDVCSFHPLLILQAPILTATARRALSTRRRPTRLRRRSLVAPPRPMRVAIHDLPKAHVAIDPIAHLFSFNLRHATFY